MRENSILSWFVIRPKHLLQKIGGFYDDHEDHVADPANIEPGAKTVWIIRLNRGTQFVLSYIYKGEHEARAGCDPSKSSPGDGIFRQYKVSCTQNPYMPWAGSRHFLKKIFYSRINNRQTNMAEAMRGNVAALLRGIDRYFHAMVVWINKNLLIFLFC